MFNTFRTTWRPHPLVAVISLLGIVLCARLSLWQYQRGQDKAAIETERAQAALDDPQITAKRPAVLPYGQRLALDGQWGERHVLLDNQTQDGRPGVQVLSSFQLRDGSWVMVNRGWMAAPLDRSQLPRIAPVAVERPSGVLRDLPQAGLVTNQDCSNAPLPRLNYPDQALLECSLGHAIWPALLLLDPQLPGAYSRRWARFEIPPERHYGYSVQWAALALTLLFIFLRFNRRRPGEPQ
jgi:cytochrome oxidase assembly protein ShyY1